jgi:mono/diheme cytochrome c family protein
VRKFSLDVAAFMVHRLSRGRRTRPPERRASQIRRSQAVNTRPSFGIGTEPSILGLVTEIPEHLLKRSRERRAAVGKGDDAGSSDAPASTTPATTKSAATAPATTASGPPARTAAPVPDVPKPPKPDPAYVVAAKQRRKVPWWAMATLGLMPVWGIMYVRALTEAPEVVEGPMGLGAEVYGSCAGCHGANGGGGVGYQFSGGEVLETYPNIEDQLRFTYWGTGEYNLAGINVPGNPEREGGAHITGALGVMPQQGAMAGGGLTDYEILGVVCHERYTLAGADPTEGPFAEEYARWCSEESPIFAALEAGEISMTSDDVVTVIDAEGEALDVEFKGSIPIEGSVAGE